MPDCVATGACLPQKSVLVHQEENALPSGDSTRHMPFIYFELQSLRITVNGTRIRLRSWRNCYSKAVVISSAVCIPNIM